MTRFGGLRWRILEWRLMAEGAGDVEDWWDCVSGFCCDGVAN